MSMSSDVSTTVKRVVIAGGNGFLGHSLADQLVRDGFQVVILTRSDRPTPVHPHIRNVAWDGRSRGSWVTELEDSDVLVNLAGRSVDCVKTPDHCDEILRSRLESTRVLGQACREVAHPPRVWIQMSTAHIYGDPPRERCDETSPTGWGLAPDVGRAWEAEFYSACPSSTRGVVLRTGFVIGRRNPRGAGALGKLAMLTRCGLGGRVGQGTQGMSWIHESDLHQIVLRAIVDSAFQGTYNGVAPNPVSQLEFMRELSRHAGGLGSLGLRLPAAEWMVRLGARFILRTDPELALFGRYVLPKRLIDSGFEFRWPNLRDALADLFSPAAES